MYRSNYRATRTRNSQVTSGGMDTTTKSPRNQQVKNIRVLRRRQRSISDSPDQSLEAPIFPSSSLSQVFEEEDDETKVRNLDGIVGNLSDIETDPIDQNSFSQDTPYGMRLVISQDDMTIRTDNPFYTPDWIDNDAKIRQVISEYDGKTITKIGFIPAKKVDCRIYRANHDLPSNRFDYKIDKCDDKVIPRNQLLDLVRSQRDGKYSLNGDEKKLSGLGYKDLSSLVSDQNVDEVIDDVDSRFGERWKQCLPLDERNLNNGMKLLGRGSFGTAVLLCRRVNEQFDSSSSCSVIKLEKIGEKLQIDLNGSTRYQFELYKRAVKKLRYEYSVQEEFSRVGISPHVSYRCEYNLERNRMLSRVFVTKMGYSGITLSKAMKTMPKLMTPEFVFARVMKLYKQIEDNGLFHGDLHGANITFDPNEPDRFTAIDFGFADAKILYRSDPLSYEFTSFSSSIDMSKTYLIKKSLQSIRSTVDLLILQDDGDIDESLQLAVKNYMGFFALIMKSMGHEGTWNYFVKRAYVHFINRIGDEVKSRNRLAAENPNWIVADTQPEMVASQFIKLSPIEQYRVILQRPVPYWYALGASIETLGKEFSEWRKQRIRTLACKNYPYHIL